MIIGIWIALKTLFQMECHIKAKLLFSYSTSNFIMFNFEIKDKNPITNFEISIDYFRHHILAVK